MERSILTGLAGFRWAAWAWMTTVLLLNRGALVRPWLAGALIAAAFAVTAVATAVLRTRPELLLTAPVVAAEVAVGAALVTVDGIVYGTGHVFSGEQSLGSAWPLAGVFAAGVAGGPVAGGLAGLLMGAGRLTAALLDGVGVEGHGLSLTSTTFLYALSGAVAGYLTSLLRRAEREISAARAREELARTLHDGVLQTLAIVERRTDDQALARLAREQERELRTFLFGGVAVGQRVDLVSALETAAARFEDAFGGRVTVVVPDDLPALDDARCGAVAGAVGEALTNAGKHGAAEKVTVYLEPRDTGEGIFCSVKDDGHGFDPATVRPGIGTTRSIRQRIEEVGGRVEIDSRPGRGTEVRMWV